MIPVLVVATISFCSAICCTAFILCCCCGLCGNSKGGSGIAIAVAPMPSLAQVAPIGRADDSPEKAKQQEEETKPKPTPRPSPRDILNQSFNSSIASIASALTPRSPRLPYFFHLGRNPETGVARDYV